MADVQEIPETEGFINSADFQQKILLKQFPEQDLNSIDHTNIVEFLEFGLVSHIRQTGYDEQFVRSIEQKLKSELLKKYNLHESAVEEPMPVEEESEAKSFVPRAKRIFKKRKSDYQLTPRKDDLVLKRLCINKLYQFLKAGLSQRCKAMRQSVSIIERLIDHFELSSQQFKANYKRLLQWLNIHGHPGSGLGEEYINQKLEDFLQQELGNNQQQAEQKSKKSEQTTYSETK